MKGLKNVLGIDIGGSAIKAGFLPGPGPRCLRFKERATPKNAKDFGALLLDIIIDYCSRYQVRALGIGCPGPLNVKKGLIINPPNLPWKNMPLKQILFETTRLPITVDNDANAFTLAEAVWGAGKNYKNVVGLTLGTGVGGGIVINKKIYHGRGNAGELGYLLQNPEGPRGPFGERGALQELLKASSLIKKVGFNKKSVADLAHEHNPRVNKVWQDFGSSLGYAIASLAHVLDPDVVVLGGQIAKASPRFMPSLKISLKNNCILSPTPFIKLSELGDSAGVVGAALLTTEPYAHS